LGVIETRQGSGLFVSDFSLDPILDNLQYSLLADLNNLADLLQIRRVLETGMIGTAIATKPDKQKQRLKKIVDTMRRHAEAGQTFSRDDREFHRLLFEFAGNSVLTKLLDIFWQTFHKASLHADIKDTDPMLTYQAHQSILDAIMAMQVEEAQVALDRHYEGIAGRLERARLTRD
jgi:DNA-binding FadR family transcriptional regulator